MIWECRAGLTGSVDSFQLHVYFSQRHKHNNMPANKEGLILRRGTVLPLFWNWFGFVASDLIQTIVYCKICLKAVVTNGDSQTDLRSNGGEAIEEENVARYAMREPTNRRH